MHIPEHFAVADADALIARLARRAAAILITVDETGAPIATHAPMLWDCERKIASGHIARANPQWKAAATRALIVLSGPEAYVSPNWYPSKAEHGKAVPTWNYEAVHLTGSIEWFDEAERLRAVVRDLSIVHEEGQATPWRIEDAPSAYIDAMLRGIVGFALRAERIEAKRKLSQNKSDSDFEGASKGLVSTGEPAPMEVAQLMRALKKEP